MSSWSWCHAWTWCRSWSCCRWSWHNRRWPPLKTLLRLPFPFTDIYAIFTKILFNDGFFSAIVSLNPGPNFIFLYTVTKNHMCIHKHNCFLSNPSEPKLKSFLRVNYWSSCWTTRLLTSTDVQLGTPFFLYKFGIYVKLRILYLSWPISRNKIYTFRNWPLNLPRKIHLRK